MKKLLLVLIFFGSMLPAFSQEIQLTEEEKEEAMDFIIKSFYLHKNFLKYPKIFSTDINFYIENPQENDKRVLQQILDDLSPYFDKKLTYVDQKEEANFIISIDKLEFGGVEVLDRSIINEIYIPDTKIKAFSESDGVYTYDVNSVSYKFSLNRVAEVQKAWYLKKAVLQGLIGLQSHSGSTRQIPREQILKNGVVQYDSHLQVYTSGNLGQTQRFDHLTPLDTYIIQTIYSSDFEDHLKSYINSKLGFWGWMNFKYSESDLKMLRVSLVAFIIVLMLILAFKPLFTRDFKSGILGYVLNSIYIAFIFIIAMVTAETIQVYDFATIYLNEEFNHTSNYIDIFKVLVPLSLVSCVLIGIVLFFLEALVVSSSDKLVYKFIKRILTFLGVGVVFFIVLILTSPNDGFSGLMVISLILLVISLIRSSFLYFKERNENLIREKDLHLANITASKNAAEVASLHARINPHFLYNSLNSIASLAHLDADKTERMAIALSDLFRHNLNRTNETYCIVAEELEAVKAYLEIEKIRFGENLMYSIEAEDQVRGYHIPRNIIQPLIENAVKHGVSKNDSVTNICLKIHQTNTHLIISVFDSGVEFPDGLVSGYGLQSVYDILHFSYGDQAMLTWSNTPEKKIEIQIETTQLKDHSDDVESSNN